MRTTRFSGAEWATELKQIMLIGAGGIGSWVALSLARIGHELHIIDPDLVDETNITGGQMYTLGDLGKPKVEAVIKNCYDFGCIGGLDGYQKEYNPKVNDVIPIMISGLDNMKARKLIFESWSERVKDGSISAEESLLMDGRLTLENSEVFCLQGTKPEQWEEYKQKWLFKDEEVEDVDCTMKQTTFAAMGIAGLITATLCNWLTNKKLGMELRDVPFHQRLFYPAFDYRKTEVNGTTEENKKEERITIMEPVSE